MSEKIAIRDAYGEALRELGGINEKVVALEANPFFLAKHTRNVIIMSGSAN